MKSPDTKLTFGINKGLTLRQVPDSYLEYILKEFTDGTIIACAQQVKAERARGIDHQEKTLDAQGDDFLREHGINPTKYHTPVKYQPRRR